MVSRRGFSLVEVMVALLLLGTGVLSLAAGLQWAERLRSEAEAVEAAEVEAAGVMDSLFQVGATGAGEWVGEGFRFNWSVTTDGALLRIEVRFVEPALLAEYGPVRVLRAPPPPALGELDAQAVEGP